MKNAMDKLDRFYIGKIADESHEMKVQRVLMELSATAQHQKWEEYMQEKKALVLLDLEETDFGMEPVALLRLLETYQRRSEGIVEKNHGIRGWTNRVVMVRM